MESSKLARGTLRDVWSGPPANADAVAQPVVVATMPIKLRAM
jgi:hypothetical protein